MSIVSSSFLFLFLPLSVLLYYLIPKGKNLYFRNLFLVAVSLFFYAWGEPLYLFLLIFLMLFVFIAGKLVDGKQNTTFAKIVIFITVAISVSVIVFCRFSRGSGRIPLGMSFFVFFAISYVVDIYRGKCNSPKHFLHTALYLSAFFKVTQGPIIQYNQFQSQIENRRADCDMIYRGTRRFIAGLAKKVLIVSSFSGINTWIFSDGIGKCTVVNAWLGCVVCLIDTFIDFSAYTDMACGMALLFGFRLPENFNYPYIAHSVTEYWQRWHITLIQWFKDYLFYPITLGPSVRFRKFMIKRGVNKETAKKLQNIFVPACVWIPTALWHGANINYLLWGLFNCAICIIEMNIISSKKRNFPQIGKWLYTIIFLTLMTPLLLFNDIGSSFEYYGFMFGLGHNALANGLTLFILKEYGIFIIIGIILCFPLREKAATFLKNKLGDNVIEIFENVILIALAVISIAYVVKNGSTFFIYQMY